MTSCSASSSSSSSSSPSSSLPLCSATSSIKAHFLRVAIFCRLQCVQATSCRHLLHYIYNLLEFFTLLNFQLHVAALAGMCVVPLLTIGYLVTLAQHMKHEIFDLALFLSENQSYLLCPYYSTRFY